MSKELWTAVDHFLSAQLVAPDPILDAILQSHADANFPLINVVPTQGKFLNLLVRILGAKRILEIGTLAGYSTIWLARALPAGGQLITLESEPKHADVAIRNIARAGLGDRVQVRVGQALETLPVLAAE